LVKSYTALQTVRYRQVSAVMPWRHVAEMGAANSLHASA